jgi:hypothetical protein
MALALYLIVSTGFHIHGIILSFKKKWYIGLAALTIPWFALIISIAKVFFKKDLLK